MRRKAKSEVYPLLTTDWLGNPTYRQKPLARNVRHEEGEYEEEMEDDDEVFDIIDNKKKRNVNMVWLDVTLICVDFLQILALMQSMALRWVWPKNWLTNTYWILGFNLDYWEIMKFIDEDTYKSIQNYYTPSSTVDASWKWINIVWIAVVVLLAVIYAALHLVMKGFFYPSGRARRFMSRVQYVYMILVHILSLPFGVVLFRNFQCEPDWKTMYTINEHECFSTSHWIYAAPSVFFILLVFVVWPAFLVWKIRLEGMIGTSSGYLSHLLLKETEYKIHVNWSWLYDSMWVFSSFKHRGCYYRPIIQVFKLLLLIIFAACFHYIDVQAILITVLMVLAFILFCFIRPYRLTSCNLFLCFGILCHIGTGFLSTLLAHYNVYSVPNAWLTPAYSIWFLVFAQGCWAGSLAALLLYLVSRTLCHSTKMCYKRPVWPNIVTSGRGRLTAETRKFMIAIIKAKIAYEKIIRMPAMFSPVHDLARHIHIINTYWREAEYTRDALHMVLWEVLDDLVEKHAELSTKSLFADSVKKSIRRTAFEFMRMVPMFSQRLAQRDYDLILVNPVKKRLLMKMYIMGLFLNGRKEKVAKKKLLEPAVDKVWPPLPADREFEEEDGYYEDLYPQPLQNYFTDDLLNVVVENSTDNESTEEEDNVNIMLNTLPHVDLLDLENTLIEEEEDDEVDISPFKQYGKVKGAELNSRPSSAVSQLSVASSASSATLQPRVPSQPQDPAQSRDVTQSSLFGSHASLRPDNLGSLASIRHALSPPTGALSPPPQYQGRPTSAGSAHSGAGGRGRSPTGQRSPAGGSVISLTPTRPESAGSSGSGPEMATVNPGYIPDQEEEQGAPGGGARGDNLGYEPDEEEHAQVVDETAPSEASSSRRKKSGSRHSGKGSAASSAGKKKSKRRKSNH